MSGRASEPGLSGEGAIPLVLTPAPTEARLRACFFAFVSLSCFDSVPIRAVNGSKGALQHAKGVGAMVNTGHKQSGSLSRNSTSVVLVEIIKMADWRSRWLTKTYPLVQINRSFGD